MVPRWRGRGGRREMTSSDTPPETLGKHHQASNPNQSVWVSANAGSGKTHVLASRVIRLLLQGVAPSKILCLTFTNAAAANMAGRVFETLAQWTRLADADLRTQIVEAGAPNPGSRELVEARKLFARTLETPGGLKIQTIHAFCERLLHLFPFEAEVAAGFRVVEPREADEMLKDARQEVLSTLTETDAAGALALLADEAGPDDFEQLLREALGLRAEI